jgi:CRISPR-associated endonuclease Csn1
MRTLGLDLGISSIGWALIEGKKNNVKIIDLGVRKFTAGQAIEQGKIVGPPALPRREARSSRRTIRRKKARLTKIKQLLKNYKLIESEKSLFYNKKMLDVWSLRSAAVNGKLLSAEEFARILIHIAKHRGYMSSFNDEDIDDKDNDKDKIKKAISKTEKKIKELNYQTYGEYVYKEANNTCMRNRQNKDGKADYKYFPTLSLLKNEIDIIFEKQIQLGNKYALNQLKNEYWEIASSFKEPKSLENMVGYCTFFKKEKRAPKHSYLAERFVLLTSIFNTIVIDEDFNETKIVNIKPLKDIINFTYKYDSVTYKQLRNFLSIDDKTKFKGINYDKKRKADPESNKFVNLQGFNIIKKICGEEIASNKDLSLKITQILSYYKSVNQRTAELSKINELNVDMINALVKLENIDGFINLSAKSVDIILTYMETGLRYDEAVKKARDNGKLPKEENLKQDLLPALNKTDIFITNPTVLRALSETRKVINAVIRKYGPLDNINIELAREIKTKKEKQRYLQTQYKNKDNKTQAEKLLKQIGINNPSSKNILKARLYIQQSQQNGKCICLYSGETIELGKLLDEGYYQIDHILPKSRSMDDSFKILAENSLLFKGEMKGVIYANALTKIYF